MAFSLGLAVLTSEHNPVAYDTQPYQGFTVSLSLVMEVLVMIPACAEVSPMSCAPPA